MTPDTRGDAHRAECQVSRKGHGIGCSGDVQQAAARVAAPSTWVSRLRSTCFFIPLRRARPFHLFLATFIGLRHFRLAFRATRLLFDDGLTRPLSPSPSPSPQPNNQQNISFTRAVSSNVIIPGRVKEFQESLNFFPSRSGKVDPYLTRSA